ncbi:MAG: helix-turn-helix domain-containing protein [Kiritimatiellia bacterium]
MAKIKLLHEQNVLINYNSSNWTWSSDFRGYYNLWICLEGEGEMVLNQRKFDIFPGMGILLPPEGLVHAHRSGEGGMKDIGMHFLAQTPEDELGWITHTGSAVQLRSLPLIREMAAYMDFLQFQAEGESREELNRLAEVLLSVYLRDLQMGPEAPVDRRIRKQAEAMRAEPERTRSGEELAAAVGLSFSQFARRFQRLYKMSPRDFLLFQRVEKARTLLRESQMSVGEIAESLGYRDMGYFSRQFKQKTGLSPLALRKRFQGVEVPGASEEG